MLDPQDDQPAVETDERFPSGPWTGFFIHPDSPRRHRMELEFAFRDSGGGPTISLHAIDLT